MLIRVWVCAFLIGCPSEPPPAPPPVADADGDSVPDSEDQCPGFDDSRDTDADGVADGCDRCPGFDDAVDSDDDTVPDGCDRCPDLDDTLDADGDEVPDGCDVCPGFDDASDNDQDTVPNGCDICPDADDGVDEDADTIPDGCDACPGFDDALDEDEDGVADGCDRCPGPDDRLDDDGDGVPDGCDRCALGDDALDTDGDANPDACDACPGFDDTLDDDLDLVPNGCDRCPGFDDSIDADGDGAPDECDQCPGFDDRIDSDKDTTPDGCDQCPLGDDEEDVDLDGIPDACDSCLGGPRSQSFPAALSDRIDALFVIDDAQGGPTLQASLAQAFPALVAQFDTQGVDWQIGIITTSESSFRGPIIVAGPDAITEFNTQVNVGVGMGLSQGLDQIGLAIQPGGDAAPGGAFLRGDSIFALFIVTDTSDQSTTLGGKDLYDQLVMATGDPNRLWASGVLSAQASGGYDDLISLANGSQFDLSTVEWTTALTSLGTNPALRQLSYPLDEFPDLDTLEVSSAGMADNGWIHDRLRNAVQFDRITAPSLGDSIDITYDIDCQQSPGACQDGVDNDLDGLLDYPDEPGCTTPFDTDETDPIVLPTCFDGVDNDVDGLSDYPADPECRSSADRYEACTWLGDDAFGYQMCEESGAAIVCPDLSATGDLQPLGNDGVVTVPLGFAFDVYGTIHNEVYVGANGTLTFDNPTSPSNDVCQASNTLGRSVLVWWDDLDSGLGQVWTETAGSAPERSFHVQWRVPHANGDLIDVRAVLQEGTNDIALCYVDTTAGPGLDDGESATAGLVGNARVGLEANCETNGLSADRVLRFQHP
ncbi:MAG: hypothetical protein AAGA48_03370 [Myxococcota bacterium]